MDLSAHLSPSFTLGELVTCGDWDVWKDRQIAGLTSWPGTGPRDRVVDRLGALALTILQPIRDHVGGPVDMTSGYRCWAKNGATPGSSATSQHVKGEAGDCRPRHASDAEIADLWAWIAFESGLPFGQVIAEDRRPGVEGGGWVHVSLGAPYRLAKRCGEVWTCDFVKGKPIYTRRDHAWWLSPAGRAWRASRGTGV